MIAIDSVNSATYENCQIPIYWLTDSQIAYEAQEQAASSTIAAQRATCNSCTEESGKVQCGFTKAMCYLYIPDAEDVMRVYKLKQKAEQGFPLNLYYQIKRELADLATTTASSTAEAMTASTTGMYLYLNGVKTSAPLLTPKMLAEWNTSMMTFINLWLGRLIYFVVILYFIKRLRQKSGAQAE